VLATSAKKSVRGNVVRQAEVAKTVVRRPKGSDKASSEEEDFGKVDCSDGKFVGHMRIGVS
jgi:hypothetical protein